MFWPPQNKKHIGKLEQFQQRPPTLKTTNLPGKKRLMDLGLFSLRRRQLWGDLIAARQYMQGGYEEDGARLFVALQNGKTRDNRYKLKQQRSRLEIRRNTSIATVKSQSRLPRAAVRSTSSKIFQNRLNKPLSTLSNLV